MTWACLLTVLPHCPSVVTTLHAVEALERHLIYTYRSTCYLLISIPVNSVCLHTSRSNSCPVTLPACCSLAVISVNEELLCYISTWQHCVCINIINHLLNLSCLSEKLFCCHLESCNHVVKIPNIVTKSHLLISVSNAGVSRNCLSLVSCYYKRVPCCDVLLNNSSSLCNSHLCSKNISLCGSTAYGLNSSLICVNHAVSNILALWQVVEVWSLCNNIVYPQLEGIFLVTVVCQCPVIPDSPVTCKVISCGLVGNTDTSLVVFYREEQGVYITTCCEVCCSRVHVVWKIVLNTVNCNF